MSGQLKIWAQTFWQDEILPTKDMGADSLTQSPNKTNLY